LLLGFPKVSQQKQSKIEKRFLATLKVYTLKNVEDVRSEFMAFFEILDVDQNFENFVKAYWMYPNYIIFESIEIESM
jgi:hypothetical protein